MIEFSASITRACALQTIRVCTYEHRLLLMNCIDLIAKVCYNFLFLHWINSYCIKYVGFSANLEGDNSEVIIYVKSQNDRLYPHMLPVVVLKHE